MCDSPETSLPSWTPAQCYYELYMDVFDKLALLEMHLQGAVSSGAVTAKQLYEHVQVCGCTCGRGCRRLLNAVAARAAMRGVQWGGVQCGMIQLPQ